MAINTEAQATVLREDAELVVAVLGGDHSAYGTLYDRYVRLIEAVCFDCTGDAVETQDLCQDVFLLAFRHLDRLHRPDRYAAWLVALAQRICRDWRRARKRQKLRIERIAHEPSPAARQVDDGPWNDDEVRRLHEAILRLPAKERLAIQSFYLLDEPARRTQQILGLSSSGLYKLLDRARGRLERWLQENRRPSHE